MLVLITRDVFFASKVTGTASALGLQAVTAADAGGLPELLAGHNVTGVMLDLGTGVAPAAV